MKILLLSVSMLVLMTACSSTPPQQDSGQSAYDRAQKASQKAMHELGQEVKKLK